MTDFQWNGKWKANHRGHEEEGTENTKGFEERGTAKDVKKLRNKNPLKGKREARELFCLGDEDLLERGEYRVES